jgi:hypothetical protein
MANFSANSALGTQTLAEAYWWVSLRAGVPLRRKRVGVNNSYLPRVRLGLDLPGMLEKA